MYNLKLGEKGNASTAKWAEDSPLSPQQELFTSTPGGQPG